METCDCCGSNGKDNPYEDGTLLKKNYRQMRDYKLEDVIFYIDKNETAFIPISEYEGNDYPGIKVIVPIKEVDKFVTSCFAISRFTKKFNIPFLKNKFSNAYVFITKVLTNLKFGKNTYEYWGIYAQCYDLTHYAIECYECSELPNEIYYAKKLFFKCHKGKKFTVNLISETNEEDKSIVVYAKDRDTLVSMLQRNIINYYVSNIIENENN